MALTASMAHRQTTRMRRKYPGYPPWLFKISALFVSKLSWHLALRAALHPLGTTPPGTRDPNVQRFTEVLRQAQARQLRRMAPRAIVPSVPRCGRNGGNGHDASDRFFPGSQTPDR